MLLACPCMQPGLRLPGSPCFWAAAAVPHRRRLPFHCPSSPPVQGMVSNYAAAMRASGFNASQPAYVASGLLSYGDKGPWKRFLRVVREKKLASGVYHKEQFLPKAELKGAPPLLVSCLRRGVCSPGTWAGPVRAPSQC